MSKPFDATLNRLIDLRPDESFAYFDIFWVAAAVSLGLVFLVPLMKRPAAEKSPTREAAE